MAAVAPMDLVGPEPTEIVLKCTICPKKPKFSDLSHLLTHLGSKGHLSQAFKLSLRREDRDAQNALDEFYAWYNHHKLGPMLSTRQTEKEKKETARVEATAPKRSRRYANKNDAKRTGDKMVIPKAEPDSYDIIPSSSKSVLAQCNMMPGDTLQAFGRNRNVFPTHGGGGLRDSAVSPSNATNPAFEGLHLERAATEDTLFSDIAVDPDLLDDNDTLPNKALKGPTYPGMSSFDAASDSQRRRRNQRKDESVLNQMKQTSAIIEPTEYIWTELGVMQRIRDIYEPLSQPTTPVESEAEEPSSPKTKKKRARRAAAAKAKAAKNAGIRKSRVPPRASRISARIANAKGKETVKIGPANAPSPREDISVLSHDSSNRGDNGYLINGLNNVFSSGPYSHGPLQALDMFNLSSTPTFFPPSSDGSVFHESSDLSAYARSLSGAPDPSPDRTEGSWEDATFDSQRTAMQALNPNNMHLALNSPMPQSINPNSFAFLSQADGLSSGFPSQAHSPVLPGNSPSAGSHSPTFQERQTSSFFTSQHRITGDSFHSAFAQPQHGLPYQSFGFVPSCSTEPQSSTNLHTGNSTTGRMSENRPRLSYSNFQAPFSEALRGGHSEYQY